MITTTLINFFADLTNRIFFFLPRARIVDLPIIGDNLGNLLDTIIPKWNAFMDTFPYAETVWDIFIFVIIPFEILVMTVKFFLGNRSPIKD